MDLPHTDPQSIGNPTIAAAFLTVGSNAIVVTENAIGLGILEVATLRC